MKKILFLLDSVDEKAEVVQKILENPQANKTLSNLGYSFLLIIACFLVVIYIIFSYSTPRQRPLLSVNLDSKQIADLPTVAYPQQSRQSRGIWISNAVRDINSLSFEKLDQNIANQRIYFLDDSSHSAYAQQLEASGVLKNIVQNKVRITAVILKEPVQINTWGTGENVYWLYRVPVLLTYNTGNKKPSTEIKNVEILMVRVPAYKNHLGLAISRMNVS